MPKPLSKQTIRFLETFARSCRHTIIAQLKQAQSGHPGGSLGCMDYLSLLYTQIISKTDETVVVSNGHISPAVYAVLAEMGVHPKKDVIDGFRTPKSIFEGHVAREVRGVSYGTGPLGIGISAACGFAYAEKLKDSGKRVYALLGDGESQEGQVYEAMNFAAKYKLGNLIAFMDYNEVQLSDALKKIMPLNPRKLWEAAGWKVIEVHGHDFASLWSGLQKAQKSKTKPVLLLGLTTMGRGVDFMEKAGRAKKATWHGNAPNKKQADQALQALQLSRKQEKQLDRYRKRMKWLPPKPRFPKLGRPVQMQTGKPTILDPSAQTDCRTAYGKALLDIAQRNPAVVALTADLAGSVRTSYVKEAFPARHIECGIAEQHMMSCAGGLSLSGFVPFVSTFGAFMTSRAKDQARVNDLNQTNVKMVATHCGLSVGKDGPTHQAIDDLSSFMGLLHTYVLEPADPNQCDHMVRWLAGIWGNVYLRMGRHKLPILTKENGKPFFDAKYRYRYGRCDVLRRGTDLTLAAAGPMVAEALTAKEILNKKGISVEIVMMSSAKAFDKTLIRSIQKTKRVVSIEDHGAVGGYGTQLAATLQQAGIQTALMHTLGVRKYQRSGTPKQLYALAGLSGKRIAQTVQKHLS